LHAKCVSVLTRKMRQCATRKVCQCAYTQNASVCLHTKCVSVLHAKCVSVLTHKVCQCATRKVCQCAYTQSVSARCVGSLSGACLLEGILVCTYHCSAWVTSLLRLTSSGPHSTLLMMIEPSSLWHRRTGLQGVHTHTHVSARTSKIAHHPTDNQAPSGTDAHGCKSAHTHTHTHILTCCMTK